MAKLKAKIAKLEDVPEAQRALYVEKDGSFVLDLEGAKLDDDVQGLERSRSQVLHDNKKLVERLKAFEAAGIEPEDVSDLLALKQKADDSKQKQTEIEKVTAQLNAYDKKSAKWAEREGQLVGEIRRLHIETAALSALSELKGSAKLMLPVIRSQVDVVEENGAWKPFVKDALGQRRIAGTNGEPLSIKDLVVELKSDPEYSRAFEGAGGSGSGMPPSGAGAGTGGGRVDTTGMSPEQRLALGFQRTTPVGGGAGRT